MPLHVAGTVKVVGEKPPARFVRPDGLNANTGRDGSAAWQTIDKALASTPDGGIAYLLGGGFPSEEIVNPRGVTRQRPITIKPWPTHADDVELGSITMESWNDDQHANGTLGRIDNTRFEGLTAATRTIELRGSNTELVDCRLRGVRLRETSEDILVDLCDLGGYDDISQEITPLFVTGRSDAPNAQNVTIRRSEIHHATVCLANLRYFDHLLLEDVEFHHLDRTTAEDENGTRIHPDGIRTYSVGSPSSDLLIRRCSVLDCEGQGLFFKDGTVNGIRVESSLFARMIGGFDVFNAYQEAVDLDIVNSTFAGTFKVAEALTRARMLNTIIANFAQLNGSITRANNMIGTGSSVATVLSEISANASYQDAPANDYRPTAGHAALAAGAASLSSLVAPSLDRLRRVRGTPPDIGADERV